MEKIMNKNIKICIMGICALTLTACTVDESTYQYYPIYYNNTQPYTMYDYNTVNYDYKYNEKQDVVVPESYHVGELHSPVSFKDRDQNWVNGQDPNGYTIELVDGDKASRVAQVLYKAPKNNRMAQVKYERDGKEYYRGVYGSYTSSDEAQKALNALPPEIKNSASIKNWSNVQH